MFKGLFKKDYDDFRDTVVPVVEKRRKEKFETPLLYDEEFSKPVKVETKDIAIKKPVTKTAATSKKVDDTYQSVQIISPFFGVEETKKTSSTTTRVEPKKKKVYRNDQLVPIISPFFGSDDASQEEPVEASPRKNQDVQVEEESKPIETVEDNLRNIAKIMESKDEELRLIEERTGEFRLNLEKRDDPAISDMVEDSTTMSDLMQLYEKKFTE